jgi:hypothetical protein
MQQVLQTGLRCPCSLSSLVFAVDDSVSSLHKFIDWSLFSFEDVLVEGLSDLSLVDMEDLGDVRSVLDLMSDEESGLVLEQA